MNICFISGKIISDINFKFIINSKNISICYFNVQLSNKSIIKCLAYNEMADFCYCNLRKSDNLYIQGFLNSNYDVIIEIIRSYKKSHKTDEIFL